MRKTVTYPKEQFVLPHFARHSLTRSLTRNEQTLGEAQARVPDNTHLLTDRCCQGVDKFQPASTTQLPKNRSYTG